MGTQALDYYEIPESNTVYEVYDLNRLPAILHVEDVVEQINMNSLSDYVLGNSLENGVEQISEDSALQRLSLAYEDLYSIPRIIVDELGDNIKILDISNNKINDLSLLGRMKKLSFLICDHNEISSRTQVPYMPQLELLWLNYCKISELYSWCRKLRTSCPFLRYLSLMGNPAVPSFIRGSEFYDYTQYRLFIISLFPRLIHLDEKEVTFDERKEAERLYQTPSFVKLIPMVDTYLRKTTKKLSEMFPTNSAMYKQDII